MSKDIIIELTKDHGTDVKGTRYGVPSVAVANRLYPDHKVVSHVDGSDYETPASKSAPKTSKASKAPKAPKADPDPVTLDATPEPAGDAA